ncbi:tetratricopeptide repeat protein [Nocardioides humilatus]|uniref:Tetratricopeptide repeat protein n=1 Tax=Nocardioides humilatus TaxID=2607660 RepID=A0A5B1LNK7_9ACTN|nr:tetratricopeptide repeat protein [Nocardioides humilatus]KAA1421360.1 tetratricopeptide repeat protein [Nocardioides humilatus]
MQSNGHPSDLWDFGDPAGSEQRFRDAAAAAEGSPQAVWLTQVARALGLQERYDDAHDVLDDLVPGDSPEVEARLLLERGRVYRSSGDPDHARRFFAEAVEVARQAGLEELEVDALHMVALVVPTEEQLDAQLVALAAAEAATDPRARRWRASLLNNIGMVHSDAGRWADALDNFEQALAAREETDGTPTELGVARWMIAWALRNLGRTDEALVMQRALKADLASRGEEDPYVDEELALLEG